MAAGGRWLPQFSLGAFLIGVAVIAAGLAGVLRASAGWTFALGALFHILLPVSVILAISCQGSARAFWIGVVVANLWCNLYFATENILFAERLKNDLDALSQRHVEPLVVQLHQDRIDHEAKVQAEQYAAAHGQAALTTEFKQDLRQRATNGVNRSVRTSLRRFLMIVLSLGGGCLSAWAYRLRKPTADNHACDRGS